MREDIKDLHQNLGSINWIHFVVIDVDLNKLSDHNLNALVNVFDAIDAKVVRTTYALKGAAVVGNRLPRHRLPIVNWVEMSSPGGFTGDARIENWNRMPMLAFLHISPENFFIPGRLYAVVVSTRIESDYRTYIDKLITATVSELFVQLIDADDEDVAFLWFRKEDIETANGTITERPFSALISTTAQAYVVADFLANRSGDFSKIEISIADADSFADAWCILRPALEKFDSYKINDGDDRSQSIEVIGNSLSVILMGSMVNDVNVELPENKKWTYIRIILSDKIERTTLGVTMCIEMLARTITLEQLIVSSPKVDLLEQLIELKEETKSDSVLSKLQWLIATILRVEPMKALFDLTDFYSGTFRTKDTDLHRELNGFVEGKKGWNPGNIEYPNEENPDLASVCFTNDEKLSKVGGHAPA